MRDWLKLLGMAMVLANAAQADVRFVQPIACVLEENCTIQQFMDHDPGKGIVDFACGAATYDGHKGTDFRVSREDMLRGVNVLAAADGVVLRLRDGMEDRRVVTQADRALIKGKQCGNGMVVRHADGWKPSIAT